jgi:glycogen debranching enzyme
VFHDRFQGSGVSDFLCDIPITTAGIFEYHVEYRDWDTNEICQTSGGSFIVDPRLYLPQTDLLNPTYNAKNRELLPLDAISIVTVIPKWMPTLSKWLPYFHSFSNTGYNMVHFAPVNERGASDSPYSIFDQLSISADLFEDHKSMTRKQKETEFKNTIDAIYETCGILSITDVVWNHTANNSVWLEEHPESGYNLKNSPHLRSAAELDQAMVDFSDSLASVYHRDPNLNSEGQLREVMELFKAIVIPALKLWEFYVIDVANSVQFFDKSWNVTTDDIPEGHPYKNVHIGSMSLKEKADMLRADGMANTAEGRRFAKAIDLKVAIPFVQKYLHDVREVCSAQQARQEFERILNEINLDFYREYDGDLESILNQITNRARYLRVAEHGPRLGPISKQYVFHFMSHWQRLFLHLYKGSVGGHVLYSSPVQPEDCPTRARRVDLGQQWMDMEC